MSTVVEVTCKAVSSDIAAIANREVHLYISVLAAVPVVGTFVLRQIVQPAIRGKQLSVHTLVL